MPSWLADEEEKNQSWKILKVCGSSESSEVREGAVGSKVVVFFKRFDLSYILGVQEKAF